MLQTLRTNTKWIMIVVAVAFVAMIIFAWGMDITGGRSGGGGSMAVGVVNGEEIPYQTYETYVRNQSQSASQNQRITYAQQRMIHEQIWDFLVVRTLMEQEIERRKITYTDQELVNFMMTNPFQLAYQIPMFQDENGAFSMSKYQSFLTNPANLQNPQAAQLLQYIESEAAMRLPDLKLQNQIASSIIVTDEMVHERWMRENDKRKAQWLFVSTNQLNTVGSQVDPAAAEEYYNNNRDEFKRGERRALNAVFIELAATPADSAEVLQLATDLVTRARNGEDFSELANQYTDDTGNMMPDGSRRGGALGWFGKGRMVPEFEEAAFALEPGQVSDPILSQFGYHVIKVDSTRTTDDKPEVNARHILLNVEPSMETNNEVEDRINSFVEAMENDDADFLAYATGQGLQIMKTTPFERDAQMIPSIAGSTPLLVGRAFEADAGEVLPVFPADGGSYIIQVAEVRKAGIPTFDEVSQEAVAAVRKQLRLDAATAFVEGVANRLASGMSLQEAADAAEDKVAGIQVRDTTVYPSYYVAPMGSMNPLMAQLFSLTEPGQNTGVVTTDSGAGIAIFIEDVPIDEEQFENEREQLRTRLEQELQNDAVTRYVENLREKADIRDYRYRFIGL